MRYPNFLQPGDTIALTAASGPVPADKLEAAAESVRRFGLCPAILDSCRRTRGYLAGPDRARADDLTEAFMNPAYAAVICIRGGYGAHRLMEYLDWDRIASGGKGLYGYSDVTALHIELNRRGLISWHTPMPGSEWLNGLDPFTENHLRRALFGPPMENITNPEGEALTVIAPGEAEGILCGGNLSLAVSTLGTFYEIDTRGKVLFLEDIAELPYKIDKMLLHLKHAGKFNDCAAVVLGAFKDCVPADPQKPSLTLIEIFTDLLAGIGKPVLAGLACGHVLPTVCLPLGAAARVSGGNAQGSASVRLCGERAQGSASVRVCHPGGAHG